MQFDVIGLFKLFKQIEFLPVISDGQDARIIGMLNSVRLVGGHADRSNRLAPLLPAPVSDLLFGSESR